MYKATYLGEEYEFWVDLKSRAEELDACNFIREIAELRGKLSFYESRIKQMNEVMTAKE